MTIRERKVKSLHGNLNSPVTEQYRALFKEIFLDYTKIATLPCGGIKRRRKYMSSQGTTVKNDIPHFITKNLFRNGKGVFSTKSLESGMLI